MNCVHSSPAVVSASDGDCLIVIRGGVISEEGMLQLNYFK